MRIVTIAIWLALTFIGCGSSDDYNYYSGESDFRLSAVTVSDPNHNGVVKFSVTFNQRPDFFIRDGSGRAAYDFQFYIAETADLSEFFYSQIENYASIIQGGQIYVSNDIPIRDGGPADDTDPFGSWGSVTDRVPYSLQNKTVTFHASLDALGVNGPFAYLVQSGSFGKTGQNFAGFSGEDGHPIAVPPPPPPPPPTN